MLLDNGTVLDMGSPLAVAAVYGHWEIVKLLIERGAKLDPRDKYQAAALHRAASTGRWMVVKQLLNMETDVNRVSSDWEQTALMSAAAHGHAGVVDLLLKAGAKVDFIDLRRRSALDRALEGGHTQIAALLQSHGAQSGPGLPASLVVELNQDHEYGLQPSLNPELTAELQRTPLIAGTLHRNEYHLCDRLRSPKFEFRTF